MMPASMKVGSAVLLLVGKGQAQTRARAWTVARECGTHRIILQSISVTFLASLGSSVGLELIRLDATDIIAQNRSSDVS